MESHSVRAHVVGALEDVDFATFRPGVQIGLPDRGPCAAALWHVPNIEAVDGGGAVSAIDQLEFGSEATYIATWCWNVSVETNRTDFLPGSPALTLLPESARRIKQSPEV